MVFTIQKANLVDSQSKVADFGDIALCLKLLTDLIT